MGARQLQGVTQFSVAGKFHNIHIVHNVRLGNVFPIAIMEQYLSIYDIFLKSHIHKCPVLTVLLLL
jgi:hypothetical protein